MKAFIKILVKFSMTKFSTAIFSLAVILLYFQGCIMSSSNIQRQAKPDADSLEQGTCIVEGIVRYYERDTSIRDMEIDPRRIYILENFFFVENTPTYSIKNIFLEGKDLTNYENKQVRITGIIQNAPAGYYVNVQNPINIRLYISKIGTLR